MVNWDRARALAALEAFNLKGANAEVAAYWLSLWDGSRAPCRSAFNPNHVRDLLPAIALTQVQADGDVVCRLSGRIIDTALGFPLQGRSMLSLVEGDERVVRSRRLHAVVDGHIGLSHTRFETVDHETGVAETIQLPFAGAMEDGARLFLSHTNWRPGGTEYLSLSREEGKPYDGRPDIYCALSLTSG